MAKLRVYRGNISANDNDSTSITFSESLQPVLEELPKWNVLAEVLEEIERDAYLNPTLKDDSNSTILVMCTDQRTCRQLREFLESRHLRMNKGDAADNFEQMEVDDNEMTAELMMRRKLREYLNWKGNFSRVKENLYSTSSALNEASGSRTVTPSGLSKLTQGRPPPNKRRRVRGGAAGASSAGRTPNSTVQTDTELPAQVSGLLDDLAPTLVEEGLKDDVILDDLGDTEDYYELYDMNDLILIHPYDGDMDERMLEEARPRYIIMYEPDPAFIRRVEVYRSSHMDRNVKVYFMYYGGSVEEQRYLSAVRREKDAFTKLIKEKGVCLQFFLIPILFAFASNKMLSGHGCYPIPR